jgi:ribosomal protein S17E
MKKRFIILNVSANIVCKYKNNLTKNYNENDSANIKSDTGITISLFAHDY